jgi:hypothetical protein
MTINLRIDPMSRMPFLLDFRFWGIGTEVAKNTGNMHPAKTKSMIVTETEVSTPLLLTAATPLILISFLPAPDLQTN